MIELRTLGTLVLRDANGEDIGSVLAQPKRVALLSYLAIARPGGFHRRDTLLALLWPEQDEQHARWALNQALRHLRTALGKEAVRSRGDGEVGIDRGAITCDAVLFEAALKDDDPARALGLYRGDLLEGFHVTGCSDFGHWLEEERVWLRRRAARAASTLAQREERQGEPVAAGHWARRAFALTPDDEGEARQLIELLGRIGDRAGAVQAYEEFAKRLREGYEVDPAPETRALIAAVRTRQAPESSPTCGVDDSQQDARGSGRPATAPVAPRLPARRRRRTALLALSSLIIGSLFMAWGLRSLPTSHTAPSPTTIAVLPFAYRGSSEFSYLGEGMVDLLGANLDGAGEIRAVDPHAVLALTRHAGSKWNPEQARKVSAQLGAGSYVVGDVIEAGGRLRISARLHHLGAQDQAREGAAVDGVPGQLFRLVDALTIQLLKTRGRDPRLPFVNLAALTTDSLAALKVYLDGERALRAGRDDLAIEAFQRGTRIDPSFALAYYRLAIAAGQGKVGRQALDQAIRYSVRLGDHGRRLIQALDAFDRGRQRDAERLYREIVTLYPTDFEAWAQWGEVLFHSGSRIDNSWFEAREPFERVLSMEPRDASALWHLSNIAARQRRVSELDSLTQRLLQINPHPVRAAMARAQRAIVVGDTAELVRFMSAMRKAGDEPAQPALGFLTFTTGDLDVGRRLWGQITDPSRARGTRALAYKTLAQIDLMSGRWRAAQAQLDTMAGLDPATALEHRALFSLWPLQQVARIDLVALRDSLLRWKASPGSTNQTSLMAEHSTAHSYLRLYLLGLFAARLGEHSAAVGYAAELERRSRLAFAPEFVADLGRTVGAEVARLSGRSQEALRILEQASFWTQVDVQVSGKSPFYVREYERFIHAELLNALGRSDEALRAYTQMADNLFHLGAPAHLRLAQIYDQRGEHGKAVDHYARFIRLWKDCDPELRPVVEEAKERMALYADRAGPGPDYSLTN